MKPLTIVALVLLACIAFLPRVHHSRVSAKMARLILDENDLLGHANVGG